MMYKYKNIKYILCMLVFFAVFHIGCWFPIQAVKDIWKPQPPIHYDILKNNIKIGEVTMWNKDPWSNSGDSRLKEKGYIKCEELNYQWSTETTYFLKEWAEKPVTVPEYAKGEIIHKTWSGNKRIINCKVEFTDGNVNVKISKYVDDNNDSLIKPEVTEYTVNDAGDTILCQTYLYIEPLGFPTTILTYIEFPHKSVIFNDILIYKYSKTNHKRIDGKPLFTTHYYITNDSNNLSRKITWQKGLCQEYIFDDSIIYKIRK